METKHTPGPWEQGTQTRGSTTLVARIETGFAVAEMRNVHFREEAEANARLIAAAPELLEALQLAYSVLMDCIPDADCDLYKRDARRKARAAIAKAIGKAP